MPRGQRADEFRTKDKRKLPIFIHSELDDYGLSCAEFRAYSRIARRAGEDSKATESVPHMAEAFGVDVSTVRRALKVLCICHLISKHERPGWTPEYTLEDKIAWRDKSELKAVRERVLHPKKGGVTLVTTHRGIAEEGSHETSDTLLTTHGTPYSPDTDEGTPVKVLPKGTPDPPTRARGQTKPVNPNQEPREPKVKCPNNILETHPEIGDIFPEHGSRLKEIVFAWREYKLGQTRDTRRTEDQWFHDCVAWISRERVPSGRNGNNGNGANGKQQSNYETASDRNVRNITESAARFGLGFASTGLHDHREVAPLQITPSAKPGRDGTGG